MLTTTDAARRLGVSRARVIALIHLGTLVATKPGRDWQIEESSVEAYRESPRKAGRKKSMNVATNVAAPTSQDSAPHQDATE